MIVGAQFKISFPWDLYVDSLPYFGLQSAVSDLYTQCLLDTDPSFSSCQGYAGIMPQPGDFSFFRLSIADHNPSKKDPYSLYQFQVHYLGYSVIYPYISLQNSFHL